MAELGLSTSSSETDTASAGNELLLPANNVEDENQNESDLEPSPKKARLQQPLVAAVCLEERLNGILCCTVCLDLPTVAVFQVVKKLIIIRLQQQ